MSTVLDAAVTPRRRPLGPLLRLVLASGAGVVAVACLLTGLSYPGFPVDAAVCAVLAAATSATLVIVSVSRAVQTGHGRVPAAGVLVLVVLLFAAGVLAAAGDGGRRLQVRWAASQPAFEQEVAAAGDPVPMEGSVDSGSSSAYPGPCPVSIGELSITECRSIDGGYLFLQAQGALTDDSGIVYLPGTGARADWGSAETMTPLGGPWWSWTCSC